MLALMFEKNEEHGNLTLHFEHSLVSMSKWEEIHEKPFFGKGPHTPEESISYIQYMCQEQISELALLKLLEVEHYTKVTEYINKKASATWFAQDQGNKKSGETITTELVYYWLIQFGIPFEPCQHWHFNRLMTLIKICGVKQAKPKRMSRQAQMEQYRQLNAERRAKLGTTG